MSNQDKNLNLDPTESIASEVQPAADQESTPDAGNTQNGNAGDKNNSIRIPFTSVSFSMPDMPQMPNIPNMPQMPHLEANPSMKRLEEIVSVLVKYKVFDSLSLQKDPGNVRIAFEELGPTFIKIGQILSTRTDMVSQEFADELKKLHSSVKSDPFDIMKPQIEEYTGIPLEELFQSLDETAFASASIAQVYKGVLKNGTPVIVKVQHQGVYEKMKLDINLLEKAVPLIKFVPAAKCIDPAEIIGVLKESLLNELDFEIEAENIEVFIQITARMIPCCV